MRADLLTELLAVEHQCRNALHAVDVYRAIDRALQRIAGHKLLTILTYDDAVTEAERLYSSDETYPVGARNLIASSTWADSVVRDGVAYVAHRVEDLRRVFDQHESLAALGLGSVVNLPVRWRGRTVGTLNMLAEEGRYVDLDIDAVRLVAQFVLPELIQKPVAVR
ncbi:GAF domain-containing protein [Paraburkholderia sp. C35]|uniref:GAF domain-containing protein n=1 Tax=Paraburkholderia sp. C35 TaxID=2126993 RepID=UPI000D697035|nr:GAF domain-containing protein [Paraburkholderia sp. C35]